MSAAISITAPSVRRIVDTTKVVDRYTDAYLHARAVVATGVVIKTLGGIIGVLAVVGALAFFAITQPTTNRASTEATMLSVLTSAGILVAGIVTAFAVWLTGLLTCSRGQQLKASLDGAVHSSPFLSDEQRGDVMSLY